MIVPSSRLIVLCALLLVPAAAVASVAPQWILLAALVSSVVILIAAIDAIRGARLLETLDVQTQPIVRLTQHRPASFPVSVRNASPRPLTAAIAVVLPSGLTSAQSIEHVSAAPGQSSLEWTCTGLVRGDYPLHAAHVETDSPLRLWHARAARKLSTELRVYPDLRDRASAALFQRTARDGARTLRQVGKGREFDRLRQYLPGDSYEDVYWKGTAKRGAPVVKLYHVEHAQQVYVAVDASRLSARDGVLDGYVEAALHLALSAEKQGDRFGLITFSDRVHKLVQAGHGASHFQLCREAIYNLQPRRVNPDFAEVFAGIRTKLTRRSLIILLTCLDDALLAEQFEHNVPVIARHHLVQVHLMQIAESKPLFSETPPESLDDVYSALAGQLHWNRVRRLQIALQNRGIRVSMLHPDTARQQIAAAYLDVKRRQLL